MNYWIPVFVQPEIVSNKLLDWISVAVTDDSLRKVSLKCTNPHKTLYNCTKMLNENTKADIVQCTCGTVSNNMSSSACKKISESDIFIPIGSHLIPLYYQREAWKALGYLKVSRTRNVKNYC